MTHRIHTVPPTKSVVEWRALGEHHRRIKRQIIQNSLARSANKATISDAEFLDEMRAECEIDRVRGRHISECGFPVVTTEALALIAGQLNGRVLDVGAGKGYLTRLLQLRGVNIDAVDKNPGWEKETYAVPTNPGAYCEMFHGDAFDYISPNYTTLLLSWPDYNKDFGLKVLERMHSGQFLLYQGAGPGGCCANDEFFEYLHKHFTEDEPFAQALREVHFAFDGMHDTWEFYRKK